MEAPGTMPMGFHYLVILDLESTCDDGGDPNRQEIVEWPWVVYDTAARSVVDYKQIFIAPAWNSNPNPPPSIIGNTGSEEDVLFAASLKEAVHHFDTYLLHSFVRHRKSFCLLTDGPWDVQHFLLLEAARKAIPLAPHYRCFFNLRAEFTRRYPQFGAPRDRYGMMNSLGISRSNNTTNGNGGVNGNNGMCNTGIDDCIAIASIVTRMMYDAHVFRTPFIIPEYDWSTALTRIPSVAVPVAAAIPIGGIVRLRGLPWSCSEMDIARFLQPIAIVPAGIHFVRNSHGKSTGEAFVQLENEGSVKAALARHRQSMGRRYIEVFKSSPNDMTNHLGRADARRIMHQQHQAHAHVHKAAAAAAAAVSYNNTQSSLRHGNNNRDRNGRYNNSGKDTSRNVGAMHGEILQSSSTTSTPTKNNTLSQSPQYPRLSSPNMSHPTNAAYTTATASGLAYVVRVSGLPDEIREDDLLPIFDGIETVGDGIHLVPLPPSISGEESTSASSSSGGEGGSGDNNNTPKRRRRRGRREAFVQVTSEAWVRKACLRTGAVECPSGSGNLVLIRVARSTPAEMRSVLSNGNNVEDNAKSYLMQVRNLEGTTTIDSIAKLFSGLGVNPGDVMISGENYARVAFLSSEARDLALNLPLNNSSMHWEPAGEEVSNDVNVYSGNMRKRGRVVRMRGLPYAATDADIMAFFGMGDIAVHDSERDISRGKDRHGRASGEAWVTLGSAKEAQLAVLKLDKKHMGSRYIELLVCGQR